jgi:hypothetical protein
VSLDPEVIKKIGLEKMPKVGDMMILNAMAEVIGVNADRSQAGGKDLRVDLQIVMLDVKQKGEDHVQQAMDADSGNEDKTLLG